MTSPDVASLARWQRCTACGRHLDERDPRTTCPDCGGLLDIAFHLPRAGATELRRRFDSRVGIAGAAVVTSGVWRYRELLPFPEGERIVSYPEGNTPLVSHQRVSDHAGTQGLLLKHEGMNPTGSFKDRGMTVGVTQARRIGASAVACASTGNTAASLAAYAAVARLPALVLVPRGGIAPGKLTQTLAYGARTLLVRGDFDTCFSLAQEAAVSLGVYLLNSVNPFRVEGQKTIAFELLHQLGWNAPDWIALPAGNLGNTGAFGKALREALASGLITHTPRLLAVQAAGAAPFFQSYKEGFAQRHRVTPETVATAIRIGNPASHDRAVEAIRQTNGAVIAVSDSALMESKAIIDSSGIGCEPASAASVAGVRRAVEEGLISPDARVVAILTGHLLKDPLGSAADPEDAMWAPTRGMTPIEIEPRLQEVERELRLAEDLRDS